MKLSNETYDTLKWVIATVLPAVEALWLGLGKVWGFPLTVEIGTTIALVTTFLGAIFIKSSVDYRATKEQDNFNRESIGDMLDYAEKGDDYEDTNDTAD